MFRTERDGTVNVRAGVSVGHVRRGVRRPRAVSDDEAQEIPVEPIPSTSTVANQYVLLLFFSFRQFVKKFCLGLKMVRQLKCHLVSDGA